MRCSASTDYDGASKLAYKILLESSQKKLPVNVKKIIRSYKNIKLVSFSNFIKKMNRTYDELVSVFGSERGFTICDLKDDKYLIVYNEKDSEETQRWTLAHELGHIVKNHLKSEEYNIIHYNEGEHPFEKEANCFAKHLLVPFPAISLLVSTKTTIVKSFELEFLFGIGPLCSEYIVEHYNKLQFPPRNKKVEDLFKESIFEYIEKVEQKIINF